MNGAKGKSVHFRRVKRTIIQSEFKIGKKSLKAIVSKF